MEHTGLPTFLEGRRLLSVRVTRRELVLRSYLDRHHVAARVRVSPVRDIGLPVVEKHALELRGDRLRLRLLLRLVGDRADDLAAASHAHLDRGALLGDVARPAGAADGDVVVAELRLSGAQLAHRVAPRVDRDLAGGALVADRSRL